MTVRRDPDRMIKAFLEDGPMELSDRAYDAVRAEIDHTSQRVVIGPWRIPTLNNLARYAIAAAAIVVVAVLGFNLLPKTGQIGGPGVTATPPPAATLAPTASPTPLALRLPHAGPLSAGTPYYIEDPTTNVKRFTFTVPEGWSTDADQFVAKNRDEPGEVLFTTWVLSHIFSDACDWNESSGLVDVGTTVDQLVNALETQSGRVASEPRDTTVGGFPAKRIELAVSADLDVSTCTNGNLRYWPGGGPDFGSGMCCNPAGNTDVLYVVDVNGKRLVVLARHYPDSSGADRAELQSIVDSIQIEP